MNAASKSNLEELKKSFPSLDDISARKLLGGWVEDPVDPIPSHTNPGTGSATSTTSLPNRPNAAGYTYFGDSDDDMGDGGYGDWGDDGPGGAGDDGAGSNPDGSVGGSGQDNPGGGYDDDQGAPLEWVNMGKVENPQPYTVYNGSAETIYYKGENSSDALPILPGQGINVPIDGLNVNGEVIKLTDDYIYVIVTNTYYETNYVGWFDIQYQEDHGGPLADPPDIYWEPLFQAIPQ